MKTLKYILCGFGMAVADSVPGVSGGTVAFLAGIYGKFIRSFTDVLHGDRKTRKNALHFLLKLGIGWAVGMILAVSVLANIFTAGIYQISSLFFGLICASVPVLIYEERQTMRSKLYCIPFALIGAGFVVGLSVLHLNISVEPGSWSIFTVFYIFFAGIFAISAMLLPGISGSSLLLSFGLYVPIIAGVKNLLHFNFESWGLILVFVCGVVVGVAVFFRGIRYMMEKKKGAVMYAVIGMMIGSLYAIIQGPTTLKEPLPTMGLSEFSMLWFIIGIAAVALLQILKYYAGRRKQLDGMDNDSRLEHSSMDT